MQRKVQICDMSIAHALTTLKNTLKPRKVFEVRRTNTFIIYECPALWELADSCARLYNGLNFERRAGLHALQAFRVVP
ncbi:MAG: hypothetical protein HA489_01700 [Archaeoglobales archaeon]|nr:hypothetical protein [Archaeoglobales archaeon]